MPLYVSCSTMKINVFGLFSVNSNVCMTFNCGYARKLRALEVRSIKTAVSVVMLVGRPDLGKLPRARYVVAQHHETKGKLGNIF